MVIVRVATARTNKFRETVFAFFTGEQAGIFEQLARVVTRDPLENAAHTEFFVACELVAGIQVAVGNDGEVFVSCATRGNLFGKAGAAL